ncbi:zinc ribbon domain-containing protein [Hallella multisaccharivorax]|uniref:double zinc ribbon domain-containing protein n=1 Tax=Hallella multisaccharivorax TaxID=310514 RepID=UPI0036187FE2
MAIIKCPECGRQISDKAPFCPNCGVAIAGKIIRCPQCGEFYFKDQEMCPNCHHLTRLSERTDNTLATQGTSTIPTSDVFSEQTAQRAQPDSPQVGQNPPHRQNPPSGNGSHNNSQTPPPIPTKKKNNHGALIAACILVVILCAVCFYFYNNAKTSKEEDAYEYAMKSDDPLVLQTYLDNYKDAPEEHIDSIQAHLQALKQNDTDWTNAVVNGSKQALLDYLNRHPDSEHKAEAQHKIDSIDWAFASKSNTLDELQAYLDEHANGEHVDDANAAIRKLKASTVQPDEKVMVTAALRHFFQAVNANDDASLQASVAPVMSNFLGKADATKADATVFLQKIYKDDITGMTWRLGNDMKVDKREVGQEEYEYTVSISVTQDIQRTDPTKEKHATYKIKATVNPDGLISSLAMTKIIQ